MKSNIIMISGVLSFVVGVWAGLLKGQFGTGLWLILGGFAVIVWGVHERKKERAITI